MQINWQNCGGMGELLEKIYSTSRCNKKNLDLLMLTSKWNKSFASTTSIVRKSSPY